MALLQRCQISSPATTLWTIAARYCYKQKVRQKLVLHKYGTGSKVGQCTFFIESPRRNRLASSTRSKQVCGAWASSRVAFMPCKRASCLTPVSGPTGMVDDHQVSQCLPHQGVLPMGSLRITCALPTCRALDAVLVHQPEHRCSSLLGLLGLQLRHHDRKPHLGLLVVGIAWRQQGQGPSRPLAEHPGLQVALQAPECHG
mmetsp:Transcript_125803/g.367671  ORF Transcript_125803/g.367671 Transcript_125803/m.367671 type:complete len:200 (+) Transcript_125803:187-786(+)